MHEISLPELSLSLSLCPPTLSYLPLSTTSGPSLLLRSYVSSAAAATAPPLAEFSATTRHGSLHDLKGLIGNPTIIMLEENSKFHNHYYYYSNFLITIIIF